MYIKTISLEDFNMKIINNKRHYEIPGSNGRYYINMNCDIYSTNTRDYLFKQGNQVQLTLNGERNRYNTKKLLPLALENEINVLTAEKRQHESFIRSIFDLTDNFKLRK